MYPGVGKGVEWSKWNGCPRLPMGRNNTENSVEKNLELK